MIMITPVRPFAVASFSLRYMVSTALLNRQAQDLTFEFISRILCYPYQRCKKGEQNKHPETSEALVAILQT